MCWDKQSLNVGWSIYPISLGCLLVGIDGSPCPRAFVGNLRQSLELPNKVGGVAQRIMEKLAFPKNCATESLSPALHQPVPSFKIPRGGKCMERQSR